MDNGFLFKLFDWKNFELFVKDLYCADGDVIVEHDVTEIGKSGASRQIDVKVTKKSLLHTYITLIECKYWKKAVERATIDIMASSIEDLNASKGVIFTTKGYQQGAEIYAKSKNIDIFVVRDLLDEDWGLPGRNIQLYLNVVGGQMSEAYFPNAQAMLIVEEHPGNMHLEISLSQENLDDDSFLLYSFRNGDEGPNLTKILTEVHRVVTDIINKVVGFNNDFLDHKLLITSDVKVSFSEFDFRQIRNKYAAVNLSEMTINFATQISRSELKIDRAKGLDYALIVQNYVNEQAHYVSKSSDSGEVLISAYKNEKATLDDSRDVFLNGSTMNCFIGPWVGVDISSNTRFAKSSPICLKVVKSDNLFGFNIVPDER